MRLKTEIVVLGGGLAGSEAAWQVARPGLPVTLFEMRPAQPTAAHKTDWLAELVCSNSLKSNQPESASGLLKEELRRACSLLLRIADEAAVPGGKALAVDRERFAATATQAITSNPLITLRREEARSLPEDAIVIVATGPLTSPKLSDRKSTRLNSSHIQKSRMPSSA